MTGRRSAGWTAARSVFVFVMFVFVFVFAGRLDARDPIEDEYEYEYEYVGVQTKGERTWSIRSPSHVACVR